MGNIVALDEGKYVFESMLDGWSDQTSRGLRATTIDVRRRFIEYFTEFCATYPWQWKPRDLEDYSVRVRSGKGPLKRSTIRGYQTNVRLFCDFLTDPRYGWQAECLARFAAHRSRPTLLRLTLVAGFVGEEPIPELRVVAVRVEQCVRPIRLIQVPLTHGVTQPAVIRLASKLQNPARHRDGNPVHGELAYERVEPFPGR